MMEKRDGLGNQQAKVTDIEYGWVAGFFDGEGSVLLSVRTAGGKNGGPKVTPECRMMATDPESLDMMHDILERQGIGHHIRWSQPKGACKDGRPYRMAWTITMSGLRRSAAFLGWITPALATKRERAKLCLEYIGLRVAHSDFRTPIDDAELALVKHMRVLNVSKRPVTVTLNRLPPGASHDKLSANGHKGASARWGAVTSLNDRTPSP